MRRACICAVALGAIRDAIASGEAGAVRPSGAFAIEMDLLTALMAELAAVIPGTTRAGSRTVRAEAADIREAVRYRMCRTSFAANAR